MSDRRLQRICTFNISIAPYYDPRVRVKWLSELQGGFLQIYYLPRRAAAHAVIQEAIQVGELPSDTDPEILIDALYGPLYARLFLGHAPLNEKFAEKIFDLLI
jgi:hypothetical protein